LVYSTLVYRRRWGDAILVHKFIKLKALPDILPLVSQDSCTRGHNLQLSRHFSSKQQHTHFLASHVANLWNKLAYCQTPLLPKPQTALRTILTTNGQQKNGSITGKHSNQQHQTTSQSARIQLCVMYYQSGIPTRKNP